MAKAQVLYHRLSVWCWKTLGKQGQSAGSERGFTRDSRNGDHEDSYVPRAEDYPVFPPPPPRLMIEDPSKTLAAISSRKFGAPQGVFEDSPLFALYRLYEFIVLDQVRNYRNCLEAFWRQSDWSVRDIPDPADADPERYAFLAACTFLLVRSFNERIKLGLRRDMPALMTPEEAEACRNIPDDSRPWEEVPAWATDVAPLDQTFVLPTHDGEKLESKQDTRADPDFLSKHILLWTPHVHFT